MKDLQEKRGPDRYPRGNCDFDPEKVESMSNFSLTVDERFYSISSRKCSYSLGAAFSERQKIVPQIKHKNLDCIVFERY